MEDGVRVVAHVNGLTPGLHGFHVHEKGDLSAPDLASAGGHFNPGGHKHGGPEGEMRHAGDLGNLEADAKGHAMLDKVFHGISLKAGLTKDDFDSTMAVHPTAAEELVTMYRPSYLVKNGERVG